MVRRILAGIIFLVFLSLGACVSVVVVSDSQDIETDQEQDPRIDSERDLEIKE